MANRQHPDILLDLFRQTISEIATEAAGELPPVELARLLFERGIALALGDSVSCERTVRVFQQALAQDPTIQAFRRQEANRHG